MSFRSLFLFVACVSHASSRRYPTETNSIAPADVVDGQLPRYAYFYNAEGWLRPDLNPLPTKALRAFIMANPTWHVRPVDKESWVQYITSMTPAIAAGAMAKVLEEDQENLIRLALLVETGGVFMKKSVVSTRIGDWGTPTKNSAGAFALKDAAGVVTDTILMANVASPLLKLWHSNAMQMINAAKPGWYLAALQQTLAMNPGIRTGYDAIPQASDGASSCRNAGDWSHTQLVKVFQCTNGCEAQELCKLGVKPHTDQAMVDLTKYPHWYNDRRWSIPEFKQPGGRLFFIHIPKTGGTAIEDAGERAGYSWGGFDRHYDGLEGDGHPNNGNSNRMCGSPWHEPYHYGRRPGLQQSFCTIREPVDKILSEFNFRITEDRCNEADLEKWIKGKLDNMENENRHIDDCHLLPSEDYVQSCTFPIPFDHKHEGLEMFLRIRFNVTFDRFDQVHPIHKKKCNAKPVNVSAASMNLMKRYYATDFDIFRNARKNFGNLIKEGMVSPQTPDMCPKGKECHKHDKVAQAACPYNGCLVPWLDMDVGKDYPCIKTSCNPQDKKCNSRRVGRCEE